MKEPGAKTLRSETVLDTKWFTLKKDLAELPNGKSAELYVINLREACSVVAINNENQVILIKQYRYPIKGYLWELPAGIKDEGESLEECALREMEEETGYRATKITPLITGYYQLCSIANPIMNIFLAEGLSKTNSKEESSEVIKEVKFFDFEEIYKRAVAGQIKSAFTTIGILLAHEAIRK